MKKISAVLFGLLGTIAVSAQGLDYKVSYVYFFDNMEYAPSHSLFQDSGTMHGMMVTPLVGYTIEQDDRISHETKFGFKARYGMGQVNPSKLTLNWMAYYDLGVKTTYGRFDGVFGVYPRKMCLGTYDISFIDEELSFTKSLCQGALFRYREPGFNAELGLDWVGKKDGESRERFFVFSGGDVRIGVSNFHVGWAAQMYHFASSEVVFGVVDNVKVEPYVKYNYAGRLIDASASLKWLQTYQRDRIVPDSTVLPGGAILDCDVSFRGFGLSNFFYYGEDLMPFYNSENGGVKYGADLYWGQRFLHTQIKGYSFYDRAMLYYKYRLSNSVNIIACCNIHLGNPTWNFGVIRGYQQIVKILVNLDSKTAGN